MKITFFSLLLMLMSISHAQEIRPDQSLEQKNLVSLLQGTSAATIKIKGQNGSYQLLEGLFAVKDRTSMAFERSLSDDRVVAVVGGYTIMKLKVKGGTSVKRHLKESKKYQVVFNTRLKRLAVLNGVLRVKLVNMKRADDIAEKYQTEIIHRFNNLGYLFLDVTDERNNLISIYQNMEKDPEIKEVTLEVVERQPSLLDLIE